MTTEDIQEMCPSNKHKNFLIFLINGTHQQLQFMSSHYRYVTCQQVHVQLSTFHSRENNASYWHTLSILVDCLRLSMQHVDETFQRKYRVIKKSSRKFAIFLVETNIQYAFIIMIFIRYHNIQKVITRKNVIRFQ